MASSTEFKDLFEKYQLEGAPNGIILAATDLRTDIGRLAEANGYGLWCESGDIAAFNRCLDRLLYQDTIREMGERGYEFLVKNYQVSVSYQTIMKHIK